MRFGLCGDLIPTDPAAIDDRVAARIAELGFSAVTAQFRTGGPEEWRRARATLERHGIRIEQAWAFGANFAAGGAEPVALAGEAMRAAAALGAGAIIGGAGSAHPAGGYRPHPDNRGGATRDRLVRTLREVAARGQEHGVALALECHVLGPLHSPEAARDVLDAVGSPWLRVNLDPANFVGDLATLYAGEGLIARMFDALGPYAVSGHAKDVYVEDGFVLHLSETVPGDGELALPAFLRRFAAELPEATMFVEHLPAGLVARARMALEEMLHAPG
jgi:sugar phosphate isomerase/epimerase